MLVGQRAAWAGNSLGTESTVTALDSDRRTAPLGMGLCDRKQGGRRLQSPTWSKARHMATTLHHHHRLNCIPRFVC